MPRAIRSDQDFLSVSRITNLPDAVSDQEPATLAQVRTFVEGISWKSSVRVASTANINLSSPGATIDAITMASGDRFLAKDQTTASQNGIYVWNGAASAATRALDANVFRELEGAVVIVEEGTSNANTRWRQTAVNGTIGSSAITFVSDTASTPAATETVPGIARVATQAKVDTGTDDTDIITSLKLAQWSGRLRKASGTVGDGSGTSFAVTHNLNTTDVIANTFLVSTGAEIVCDVTRNSVNQVTVAFSSAPTLNSIRVVVIG